MNKKQYMAKIRRALWKVDARTRQEIIRDVKSNLDDFDEATGEIVEHFGTPESLVARYLADTDHKSSALFSVVTFMRQTLVIVGIVTLCAILLMWGAYKYFGGDHFDLADETNSELDIKDPGWQIRDHQGEPITLESEQAHLALYWHDLPQIAWRCEKDSDLLTVRENRVILKFLQNRCLVFLPFQQVSVKSFQTNVVMVRPQVDVNVTLRQSELRMAENGQSYVYDFDLTQSEVNDLVSDSAALVRITASATQSRIEAYEY